MKIIAFDPGGTTGIAMTMLSTTSNHCGSIVTNQMGPQMHHQQLYRFLTSEAPAVIVYERFVYQDRKKKVVLDSVEYIGVLKLYAEMTKKALAPQMASSAKALWTDDKLKHLGLWVPGQPHAMDATRHLLLFITNDLGIKQFANKLGDM